MSLATTEDDRLRVVVIGGGAAGLAAARHALTRPDKFTVTVYEQTGDVGGTWVYTEETKVDRHGLPVHSSMYYSLRTNLPKEIMAFPDFPFPTGTNSFLVHQQVLDYLESYARHFHVYDRIQFYSRVVHVKPDSKGGREVWHVEVENVRTKERQHHVYDAVVVCNGHFAEPYIPEIPDLDKFEGLVQHSHEYRKSDAYRGLNVVCLGAGPSGQDLALELTAVAKKVYMSHKKTEPTLKEAAANLREVASVSKATPRGFYFGKDQTETKADVLLLCTGYLYSFPFLDASCEVQVHDKRVWPMYKHLVNALHPTMALVGLPFRVCPFPLFDIQARYFLTLLIGEAKLPSRDIMLTEVESELATLDEKGIPARFTHEFMAKQWPYFETLSRETCCDPPPPVMRRLFEHVARHRKRQPHLYRNRNYSVVNDDTFEEQGEVTS